MIKEKVGGQMTLVEVNNPIRVSIQQFYGIEINDFAVTVAKNGFMDCRISNVGRNEKYCVWI